MLYPIVSHDLQHGQNRGCLHGNTSTQQGHLTSIKQQIIITYSMAIIHNINLPWQLVTLLAVYPILLHLHWQFQQQPTPLISPYAKQYYTYIESRKPTHTQEYHTLQQYTVGTTKEQVWSNTQKSFPRRQYWLHNIKLTD